MPSALSVSGGTVALPTSRLSTMPIATRPASAAIPATIQSASVITSIALPAPSVSMPSGLGAEGGVVVEQAAGRGHDPGDVARTVHALGPEHVGPGADPAVVGARRTRA